MRDTNRRNPRSDATTCAELQDLLRRDAATATDWLVRRRGRAYAHEFAAEQKRALDYIDWCACAMNVLHRSEAIDTNDFVGRWRIQAIRSDIRDIPRRFAWIFASQVLLMIAAVFFLTGFPVFALPPLAAAMFAAVHVYLMIPALVVGPDHAKVPRA